LHIPSAGVNPEVFDLVLRLIRVQEAIEDGESMLASDILHDILRELGAS